eukprot:TRINITY_DN106303_c0_g1_i1.p1 TRINITY_DN106303_c0_g1~~TRINITY_DN106303_c0_g1_i1.p1  ORF type:complete len:322 (+),score=42.28 TRINITY_DN106303_c0_g1_i1:68-1033(+)
MPPSRRGAQSGPRPGSRRGSDPPPDKYSLDNLSPNDTPREKPEVKITKQEIKRLFGTWDLNKNGTIESLELASVFQILQPQRWTDRAVTRLFQGMDLDDDGHVSCDEFIEWIFDTGTESFKGALEIGVTSPAARTIRWSVADEALTPPGAPDILAELKLLEGVDIVDEMKSIGYFDLVKIGRLPVVPDPIRRVFEAVYLMLLPSTGITGANGLSPPEWDGILELLKDSTTLEKIKDVNARKAEFQARPIWAGYAVRTYFTIQEVDPDLYLLETEPAIPLGCERLTSACNAQFGPDDSKAHAVLKLYKWILYILESELLNSV